MTTPRNHPWRHSSTPSQEAGFCNCVIECIAGGDSCILTVGDFIRNQPVANMMSNGQMSLKLSLATTSQRVDSMMDCYQPYNLLFLILIYKTKRWNIEVNNSGSSDDSERMLSTSYAGTISPPPRCAKIQAQRVARRPGGPLCKEEADTPHHVLLRCPALMATTIRVTGFIHPTYEEARSGAYVAALAAEARWHLSREPSRRHSVTPYCH